MKCNAELEPNRAEDAGQTEPLPGNEPETTEDTDGHDATAGTELVVDRNVPQALIDHAEHIWNDDLLPVENYATFGRLLSHCPDLYRNAGPEGGLIRIPSIGADRPLNIVNASMLAPIIVDRLRVVVVKDGKMKGGLIPSTHLSNMLRSEVFLGCFQPVDLVTRSPLFLPDFTLVTTGYNDGGPGHRVFYTGPTLVPSDSLEATNRFLDTMEFEGNADRSNSVAEAVTVLLRNHWPGAKPIFLATANKSHAGKDTLILFARGNTRSTSISYQSTDWALEHSFVGAIKQDPDAGVVIVENARIGHHDAKIASAFLERFVTDPEPLLFSTGSGGPIRRKNDLIVAISTNFGNMSTDIMNRSLPSHLTPAGNVADRAPAIGNPKLEYLPAHRDQIEAELLGMIVRWKAVGMPLDNDVKHPFTQWARTVGGILRVNGFTDFLTNYAERKTEDDPVRQGLGLLGAASPNVWLRPAEWVDHVIDLGLIKDLIPPGSNESDKARERGIGIVLSVHKDEAFTVVTELERLVLRLEKTRNRQGEGEPATRYQFVIVKRSPLDGAA